MRGLVNVNLRGRKSIDRSMASEESCFRSRTNVTRNRDQGSQPRSTMAGWICRHETFKDADADGRRERPWRTTEARTDFHGNRAIFAFKKLETKCLQKKTHKVDNSIRLYRIFYY